MTKQLSITALSSSLAAVTLFFSAAYVASAATDTWSSSPSSANWNAANWTGGNNPPVAGDALAFGSSSITTLNNNFTAGTAFDGIYFTGGNSFTLNGSSVLLSGAVSNNVGVLNTSTTSQTFGTLPLVLDWGYYTFSTSAGGGIALNSGLTLNPGGVAYFDANNTSISLANDASGLISGLGGAGLTYSGSGGAFTGLATMSGTSIGTYSLWGSVVATGGAIGATTPGAAVNIELTATGGAGNTNYTLANGTGITYANTIFLSAASVSNLNVGSAGGAQTLDLGAISGIGGIYLPAGAAAQAATIGSGASTILTAGPETGSATPGTIIFAINGTANGNQVVDAENNSTIEDNLSGGAVTVVKTGTGSMYSGSTLANTYSGGTYIDEGEFRADNATSYGSGPVYVATNATAYINGTVTALASEMYLSPGVGVGANAAYASGGALVWGSSLNNNLNLSGKLHLLGNPVTSPPGNRFSTLSTSTTLTLSGQVTGTGTMEFYGGGHSGNEILANAAQNNNWTGGLLIEPRSTLSVYCKLGANNQIPNGPGTGDITIVSGGGDARFDLNGFSTTINALNAPNNGNVGKHELGNYSSPKLPSTLTMGANNDNGTFYGITSDGATGNVFTLIKIGTGTQTMNGTAAFAYHGNTTVSNGTLALAAAGQIPNSPVITVAASGTLDGSALSAGGLTIGSAQTLNCVGTIVGSTVVNGTVESFDGIGTLTANGGLTLQGGATNIWYINNATGTKGTDSGWSLLNVSGTLQINATDGSPFVIDVNSLTLGDAVGNAANFSSGTSYNWIIAQAGSISGYTDPGQFSVVTTGFANFPGAPSQWSVSQSGNNLVLTFTASQVITGPLTTPVTVNQGHDATFSVTANPSGTGTTFSWSQNSNPLSNGGTSAGGNSGNVTISTVGNVSTLTIHGVDNAGPNLDGGTIAVTVNMTLNSSPQQATSSATLNVVDAPFNPVVTQAGAMFSGNLGGYNGGGRTSLSATASGGINNTPDFTYQWYLNGNAINGATNATLAVNISGANVGNYTVVITNPAGNVTSSATAISPVNSVPNQMIFEPFDSYAQQALFSQGQQPDVFSSSQGITNLFNQLTGEPAYWTVEGSVSNTAILVNGLGPSSTGENAFGGTYPWFGLGGDSPNEMYWTTTTVNNHLRVTTNGASLFAVGGPNTNIFFSFSMSIVSLGNGSFDGTQSVFGGFATSAGPSACGLEFWTWDVSGGASQVEVGVGKGNGTTVNNVTSGVNINPANVIWSGPNSGPLGNGVWTQQSIFVVGCYSVVDGPGGSNDTVTLWIDPPASSYNAVTSPTPYLGPTSFGGTVANSVPQDFVLLNDYAPASHRITDLRVGTTWASVTPPAAPTFVLGNVFAPVGTTAVFASQNEGNPVTGGYSWQFNGGPALTDGATGHGSTISGSSSGTLTIANVQPQDYGTYTVNGANTDLSTNNTGTLTGSASALLSGEPPALKVVHSAPNITIEWPTNWIGYVLEQTPSLSPTSWTTNSFPPYAVNGTNNAVTVPAAGKEFYRLINP